MAPPRALTWDEIQDVLLCPTSTIQQLYRAIFCIRQVAPTPRDSVAVCVRALQNRMSESVLFRHEVCYILGQIGADVADFELKKSVFGALVDVLDDVTEDEVTRHEAAEGIAAVFNNNCDGIEAEVMLAYFRERLPHAATPSSYSCGPQEISGEVSKRKGEFEGGTSTASTDDDDVLLSDEEVDPALADMPEWNQILVRYLAKFIYKTADTTSSISARKRLRGPLADTCFLAVEGLKREHSKVCACQYSSYDPAFGDLNATAEDIPRYGQQLLNPNARLFDRYVAMFTLRNLKCVDPLAECLKEDTSSPVLRHELSFVLGQLEDEESVNALIHNLADSAEHEMVRHESAIALGSVGGETAKKALEKWKTDLVPMVAESCLVALDTIVYWESWEAEEKRIMALRDQDD